MKRLFNITSNGLAYMLTQGALISGHDNIPQHLGASMPPRTGMRSMKHTKTTSCILPEAAIYETGQVADDNRRIYEGALAASVSLVL